MLKFLFSINHRREINLLSARLGISKEDASNFLHENYFKKISFLEYFKENKKNWLPNGEDGSGRINALWVMKFPKGLINLHQLAGNKDLSWEFLLH